MSKKKLSYSELKQIWYKKLNDSGFKDIEKDEFNLKSMSNRFASQHADPILWQAKKEYYELAEKFLQEYQFQNNREKVIWEYHANAISIRNIVKLLKKARINTCKSVVGRTLFRLEQTMKRMYLYRPNKDNEQ